MSVRDARTVCLDIYNGPVQCAFVEFKAGRIVLMHQQNSPLLGTPHNFVSMIFYNHPTTEPILKHLSVSANALQFQQRLINAGYDFASPMPPQSRVLVTRAWRLFFGLGEHGGALWDYPGRFAGLAGGLSIAADHPEATLSVYLPSTDPRFLAAQAAFAATRTVAELRTKLEEQGWTLGAQIFSPYG